MRMGSGRYSSRLQATADLCDLAILVLWVLSIQFNVIIVTQVLDLVNAHYNVVVRVIRSSLTRESK